jgi:hypothetical protein
MIARWAPVYELLRAGGVENVRYLDLLSRPWKADDREWFERNPFRGEDDDDTTKAPVGYARTMLVRQVKPGNRLKFSICRCPTPKLPPTLCSKSLRGASRCRAVGRRSSIWSRNT